MADCLPGGVEFRSADCLVPVAFYSTRRIRVAPHAFTRLRALRESVTHRHAGGLGSFLV
jgi:hypothetical protein